MFSTRNVFRAESIIFTLMGLNYLLFPTTNAENIFGPGLYSFMVKPTVLSSLSTAIQCLGGACMLIATLFCGAAKSGPTSYMAKSVAAGHAINALLEGYHYASVGGVANYKSANLLPMAYHGVFALLCLLSEVELSDEYHNPSECHKFARAVDMGMGSSMGSSMGGAAAGSGSGTSGHVSYRGSSTRDPVAAERLEREAAASKR